MAVWPIYKSEEQRERDEVANVFGLGGGELEEEAWSGAFGKWYEECPEWAERELCGDADYQYRTGIVTGGGFLPEPERALVDDEGIEWELVETFMHSGEADCWVCGAGTGDAFEQGFWEHYDRDPEADDECGLCETRYADMPGVVYVGDSYEAIYRAHNQQFWPEDY